MTANFMPVVQLNRKPREKPVRPQRHKALSITWKEGSFIKYKISQAGWTVTAIADVMAVQHGSVSNVLAGRRHSKTIEAKIAAILGYNNWNEMVIAIRKLTGSSVA